MLLTDIFQALESGELSTQTSLIDTETGVKPENYKDVISHVNLGLTRLFERFDIQVKDLFVEMQEGVAEYHLTYAHAKSNTLTQQAQYIVDTAGNKFGDDVLKIQDVYTEIGEQLPINDITEPKSVFTSGQQSIQIPWKVTGDVVNVVYRASHKRIRLSDYASVNDIDLYLPPSYVEPLLYFIAHRHFAGIGGQSATPTSQGFLQKYEARCQEIERNGIPNRDQNPSNELDRSGFP